MAQMGFRLGIDVGGTNTDAVLMSGRDVVSTAKRSTTMDVRDGVIEAVTALFDQAPGIEGRVEAVMIGTTQFLNAFVQRRGLSRVAVIRVCLPKADGVPPFSGWPEDLVCALSPQIYMVGGGAFYSGKEYAPLDEAAIGRAAADIREQGLRSIAISASFAPMRPDIEERTSAIVRSIIPNAQITLSGQVGGIGLIDRENASLINASLCSLSGVVVQALVAAFSELKIRAPIYFSQNDGTLISAEAALQFPILTCSAGATNSLRGAAFLTGMDQAIVADIGGTTTDIGFLAGGFPRETTAANYIGGVRTNFRMPDVLSIGLGGGSLVRVVGGNTIVGPESVGFRIRSEALIFGGSTLTATDIAVRAGQAHIGDPKSLNSLSESTVAAAIDVIHSAVENAVDQMKPNSQALALVLVGGGNILISRPLRGVSQILRPQYAEVANAVGAAIALVSGRVDKLYDVNVLGREAAVAQAKVEATRAAVEAGADQEGVTIVDVMEMPMTHLRHGCVQIKVRAAGPLRLLSH